MGVQQNAALPDCQFLIKKAMKKFSLILSSFLLIITGTQVALAANKVKEYLKSADPINPPAKMFNLDDNSKMGTVVVFLSAVCPCSDSHVPEIKKLSTSFPNFNFIVINSNQDEDIETSQKYFIEKDLAIPVIKDQDAKLAKMLDAYKTPHAFILNKSGNVIYQGGVTDSSKLQDAKKFYLQKSLQELSDNKAVSEPITRTLGCVISR